MNAITQTEVRAVNTAATLETADPTQNLILVPLSQLVSRPSGRNVRKHASQSIDALAASIARVGLARKTSPSFNPAMVSITRLLQVAVVWPR